MDRALEKQKNDDIQIKGKVVEGYLSDLKNQIQMNRNRRIRQKQFEKVGFNRVEPVE